MGGTDVSEKAVKTRISVTLTTPYLEALDRLVEAGIYLGRGEVVLEALRHFLRGYGLEPFYLRASKPEGANQEDADPEP